MKEKKSKVEIEQGPGQFYYESIGMLFIVIAVITLAKLGKLGSFFTILLQVLFGDWYLLVVILILIFAVYLILNHHPFNLKNQRFLGYVICLLGFLMLTHFSVHNYIISLGNNYFSNFLNHYKNFIVNNNTNYLGGGVIGGSLFLIAYLLLGSTGVLLFSAIIILLGFTMIIDKPIIEIGAVIKSFFIKLKKYNKNFNNFFKYEIGKKEGSTSNLYDNKKKITLKYLDDYKNINFKVDQEKYLEETKGLICSILNSLNLKYKLIQQFNSYSSSLLSFQIYDEYEFSLVCNKISSIIEENIYLSKSGCILNIEINNKYNSILSLKNLLLKQPLLYNNYLMPIGINNKNQTEEVDFSRDANFLIIGEFNVGIKTFISSVILTSFIKVHNKIEFYLFDEIGEFNDYQYLFKNIKNDDIKDYLNNIINEIDDRVNTLSLNSIHNIDEYNAVNLQNSKEYLNRKIYIIELDDFNKNYDYQYIDDKIMYIIQVGKNVGIYTMFISRNIKKVSTILFSLFEKKFIFNSKIKNDKIIESSHLTVLCQKGDCLFYRDNNVKRVQLPKFTLDELNKIK